MRRLLAIIIDDQQTAIDELLLLMAGADYVEVIGTFTDEQQAKIFLMVNPVDFIILDMELRYTNGFRFLRSLPDPTIPTILYTGHSKYEDPGYEKLVVDVLLKPVSESRLMAALRRMVKELRFQQQHVLQDSLEGYEHYFQIKGPVKGGRRMIRLKDLVYVATEGGRLMLCLVSGEKLISALPFKTVVNSLPRKWFKQCYQNIVFNVNFYAAYREKTVVLTVTDTKLPVGSRESYPDFFSFIDSKVIQE